MFMEPDRHATVVTSCFERLNFLAFQLCCLLTAEVLYSSDSKARLLDRSHSICCTPDRDTSPRRSEKLVSALVVVVVVAVVLSDDVFWLEAESPEPGHLLFAAPLSVLTVRPTCPCVPAPPLPFPSLPCQSTWACPDSTAYSVSWMCLFQRAGLFRHGSRT
jgi:hypothetical protein